MFIRDRTRTVLPRASFDLPSLCTRAFIIQRRHSTAIPPPGQSIMGYKRETIFKIVAVAIACLLIVIAGCLFTNIEGPARRLAERSVRRSRTNNCRYAQSASKEQSENTGVTDIYSYSGGIVDEQDIDILSTVFDRSQVEVAASYLSSINIMI